MSLVIGRRRLLMGGVGLMVPGAVLAAPGKLAFQVFRNGTKVGLHQMGFTGDSENLAVSTEVDMVVKIGPVPVYRYKHTALERWVGGKWSSVDTTTNGNGKVYKASGRAMGSYVQIIGPTGTVRGPANAVPLTHWNQASFGKPLFNQQEGRMLKVTCSRAGADHWQIRGEAEIDDFYDASGNWMALKGKLEDGSRMEYRRI